MDFSLHEQRRLAQIEQDLSADRRLVSLMDLLGSHRTRLWRQLQYTGCRVRRPRLPVVHPRQSVARLALIAALCLTAAVPILLTVGLALGLGVLVIVTLCALPVPPVLLVLTHRWATRSRGGSSGNSATRES
jgi:hypothetical protein